MKLVLTVVLALLIATPAIAKHHHNPLRGSKQALALQNKMADREHLTRLDERRLKLLKKEKLIVPLTSGAAVKIDPRLPAEYRFARPETRLFVRDISRDFETKFHHPLQINSAVRTVEYQKKLRRRNGNAAKANSGPGMSSHLTGATIDIAKKGMSLMEIRWMRIRTTSLMRAKRIEATEEFREPCFHIMVFKSYESAHKKTT